MRIPEINTLDRKAPNYTDESQWRLVDAIFRKKEFAKLLHS